MKIYSLRTNADAGGDIISFRGDKNRRLRDFFIDNKGDGKFLKFTTPAAYAQELLKPEIILRSDYLASDMTIPIFSTKAAELFSTSFPSEVELYPLKIHSGASELEFRLCKTKVLINLVDKTNSSYMTLPSGAPILNDTMYYATFDSAFHIARDQTYTSRCVVSEAFVDLCKKHGLNIAFSELPQSSLPAPRDDS